jgi:hypothetical protein
MRRYRDPGYGPPASTMGRPVSADRAIWMLVRYAEHQYSIGARGNPHARRTLNVKQLDSVVRVPSSPRNPRLLSPVQQTACMKNDHLTKVCTPGIEAGFNNSWRGAAPGCCRARFLAIRASMGGAAWRGVRALRGQRRRWVRRDGLPRSSARHATGAGRSAIRMDRSPPLRAVPTPPPHSPAHRGRSPGHRR